MLVYRVCSEEEVDLILNSGFDNIGKYGNNYYCNIHKYQEGYRYMHFFDLISNTLYMNLSKGTCICIYDIPEDILEKYKGIGIYTDYICFRHEEYINEYAIKSNEMKIDYLRKVYLLKSYVDYEKFISGDIPIELYETIYDSSKPIIRERKKEESSS